MPSFQTSGNLADESALNTETESEADSSRTLIFNKPVSPVMKATTTTEITDDESDKSEKKTFLLGFGENK